MTTISIKELNILLVEPSNMQYRVIHDCLKRLGIQYVDHVQKGQQVIASMSKTLPDLVISAMYLPDMSGTDLVCKIRSDDDFKKIPFMLISSEEDFDSLDPVRQAGVVAILPKPFKDEELKKALCATIDLLDPDVLQLDDVFAEELKVLIVDDSQFARNHIRRTLEGFGIEKITAASNGEEAAGILAHDFFDFIVTDYNMPVMNGAELVKFIRHESNQADVPILMVTSEADSHLLAEVVKENVAICDKPFEAAVVREIIRTMMK